MILDFQLALKGILIQSSYSNSINLLLLIQILANSITRVDNLALVLLILYIIILLDKIVSNKIVEGFKIKEVFKIIEGFKYLIVYIEDFKAFYRYLKDIKAFLAQLVQYIYLDSRIANF